MSVNVRDKIKQKLPEKKFPTNINTKQRTQVFEDIRESQNEG